MKEFLKKMFCLSVSVLFVSSTVFVQTLQKEYTTVRQQRIEESRKHRDEMEKIQSDMQVCAFTL